MKIKWEIEKRDIKAVQQLYDTQISNPFVKNRVKRNIDQQYEKIDKENIWKRLVMCLLTTQQRSGPDGAIAKFSRISPFPLEYNNCKNLDERSIVDILDIYPGIRRKNKIAAELICNLQWLENNRWKDLMFYINKIQSTNAQADEREAALFIMDNLKGFGPKQSRNLLQSLGITHYEIPLDSRLMDWINKNLSFPILLRSTGLSDINFYNFVMDGIIKLCEASNIKPCVFDALIFSSFDDNWTQENAEEFFF